MRLDETVSVAADNWIACLATRNAACAGTMTISFRDDCCLAALQYAVIPLQTGIQLDPYWRHILRQHPDTSQTQRSDARWQKAECRLPHVAAAR